MEKLELPSLSHFQNGNGWIGSAGLLRYQVETPLEKTEEDKKKLQEEKDLSMTVVLWQGPFSREYAQDFARETFDVSQDGLDALLAYLTQAAENMEESPVYSPEETNAFYWAKKAEEESPKQ